MFYPESIDWNRDEIAAALAILQKIAFCQAHRARLPGAIFEAHCQGKKNISTELVLFNDKGEVYLIQRPSRQENPSEPYPNEWHVPGVTHGRDEETFPGSTDRIKREEDVNFTAPSEVGVYEVRGGNRGMYLSRIFIAVAAGEQTNPRGRFFGINEIPWDKLVASHRDVILPVALACVRERDRRKITEPRIEIVSEDRAQLPALP